MSGKIRSFLIVEPTDLGNVPSSVKWSDDLDDLDDLDDVYCESNIVLLQSCANKRSFWIKNTFKK